MASVMQTILIANGLYIKTKKKKEIVNTFHEKFNSISARLVISIIISIYLYELCWARSNIHSHNVFNHWPFNTLTTVTQNKATTITTNIEKKNL